MDEDVQELLTQISRHTQDIGRMIGSKKNTVSNLSDMSTALSDAKKALDNLIMVQARRDHNRALNL